MKYIIPGKTYEDGSVETFSILVVWLNNVPQPYAELFGLAKADEYELGYPAVIWGYILSRYTNYRALDDHFAQWATEWPLCESCAALREADEHYGLDLGCATCVVAMEARIDDKLAWLRAAELGIARWASQQWPELDIYDATSGPSGYDPGFTENELKAASLEECKPSG